MTTREKRVIGAFINTVKTGQHPYDYAVTLMEDEKSFGYLTQEAKDTFYAEFETAEPAPTESVV